MRGFALLHQESGNIIYKEAGSKYLGFANYIDSITITQFWHCNAKVATGGLQTDGPGYVPVNLYLQNKVVSWIWFRSYSLLTHVLYKSLVGILNGIELNPKVNLQKTVNIEVLSFLFFEHDTT